MSIVLLKPADVERVPNDRPRHCPYCGSQLLQRWGRVTKTLLDPQSRVTEVLRYRCCDCFRSFRDYPEGVDRASQTVRIRHLAALAWAMGLSCRDVVAVFRDAGVHLSRMTVWRDGQAFLDRLNKQDHPGFPSNYTLERAQPSNIPPVIGTMVAADLGSGRSTVLGHLNEGDPPAVKAWLEPIAKEMNLNVLLLEANAPGEPLVLPQEGSLLTPDSRRWKRLGAD